MVLVWILPQIVPPTSDIGGSSKKDMEESTFTRPQEDLLYID